MIKFIGEYLQVKTSYFKIHLGCSLILFLLIGCRQDKPILPTEKEIEEGILLLEKVNSTEKLTKQIVFANDALVYNTNSGNDSLKFESIYKLGILYLIKGDIDSSLLFMEQAQLGFQNLTYRSRELASNTVLLKLNRSLDDNESALQLISESERLIAADNVPTDDYIFYYLQKASFYYSLGLQDSTLAIANYADSLAATINSIKYKPQLKTVKGVVYAFLGNDSLAIQNYKSTLNEYEPFESDMPIMLKNIGNAYARMDLADSSLHYFKRAQYIYEQTEANETKLNALRMDIAYTLSDLNPEIALPYYNTVNPALLPAKNKFYYYYTQRNYVSTIQEKITATKNALSYLNTLELSYPSFEISCHLALYNYYSEIGDFKNALIHFEEQNTLNTAIKAEETALQIQTLELVNNLKAKDQKILNQEILITKKNELIDTQEHKFYLALIVALLIVVLLLMFFQNFRRKGKINQLKLKQKELQQQLLIKEIDPISSQLGSASETIEMAKQKLTKIKQEDNKNELNEIKILLNQWLANFNDKTSTKSAQKLVESDFLKKLNDYSDLTESEKRIVILIKQGYKTKEISDRLNLAQNTVEIYRSRIRKKLNTPQKETLSEKINKI